MRSLAVAAVMLACVVICMFSYGARAAEFNAPPNEENPAALTKLSADEKTEFVKEYYAALSRVDIPAVALRDFVIALDIGHSPLRGGAISARGVFEYQFNRRLVTELYAKLQSFGFTRSFIINPEGEEIHLIKRAAVANQRNADLFLAIHHDSVKDTYLKKWETHGKIQKYCDDFHGYSIFISRKNPKAAESARFATALGSALLNAGFTATLHHAEQENRPLLDREKGIYAFDDLVVLKAAKMPAVLLECGVIVNRIEEEKLNTPEYRDRLTDAIELAISKFASTPAATANSSQAPAKQEEN